MLAMSPICYLKPNCCDCKMVICQCGLIAYQRKGTLFI